MANQTTFVHKIRPNGGLEIRTTFGIKKALSMIESNNNYYINIYDNRIVDGVQSTDKINLSLNELDELIKLRGNLDMNKDFFQEHKHIRNQKRVQEQQTTASFQMAATSNSYLMCNGNQMYERPLMSLTNQNSMFQIPHTASNENFMYQMPLSYHMLPHMPPPASTSRQPLKERSGNKKEYGGGFKEPQRKKSKSEETPKLEPVEFPHVEIPDDFLDEFLKQM